MAMDHASQLEIIKCLRQDAAIGSMAGQSTDDGLALRLWHEEVNRYATHAEDRTMAMSIARALREDRTIVAAAQAEEANAVRDRRLAMRLAERDDGAPAPNQPLLSRISIPVSTPARPPPPPRVECLACTDRTPLPDTVQTPCSHRYCRDCASKLFQDATRDETLFPPRCCRTPIPISLVRHFLTAEVCRVFEEKLVEHNDSARTYCSNQACSVYLRPAAAGGQQQNGRFCGRCSIWTCSLCKKGHRPNVGCPDEDEEVLALGQQEGWRTCLRCRNLIELTVGCNHMTCRCGHQFCYACLTQWKECNCELWEERRLYDNAQNALHQPGQAPPGAQQIQQMAGRLRQVHECEHDAHWRRVPGRRRCEECRNFMPRFVLQCTDCRLRACVRCRYNRL